MKHHHNLSRLRDQLLQHPIYFEVSTVEHLRQFMEDHVFAVWDFMSISKRLQRDLTCTSLPWIPSDDASMARFVNEIIYVEESDEGPDGVAASHLEIYLSAMLGVGANVAPFQNFLSMLRAGKDVELALRDNSIPPHVEDFVLRTLNVAQEGTTVEVAADFLYSREDVIPEMFQRLLSRWEKSDSELSAFKYYLERHIEVDGESHGPAGRRMLERLTDNTEKLWDEAVRAAEAGILARLALWDGCVRKLGGQRVEHTVPATTIEDGAQDSP